MRYKKTKKDYRVYGSEKTSLWRLSDVAEELYLDSDYVITESKIDGSYSLYVNEVGARNLVRDNMTEEELNSLLEEMAAEDAAEEMEDEKNESHIYSGQAPLQR